MTTYAKIGVYCGITAPMHWHEPYNYWQWPWERHLTHLKPGSDHRFHNVENPIWVHPDVTVPTPITPPYAPTADEKRQYREALNYDSQLAVAVRAEYKAYLSERKSKTRPVAQTPSPTSSSVSRPDSDLNRLKSQYDASSRVLADRARSVTTTASSETGLLEGSALGNLVSAWRNAPLEWEPYILPADEPVLSRYPKSLVRSLKEPYSVAGRDYRLHLGLLPEPYVGNLEISRIFVLMLNPGISSAWIRAHEISEEHREELKQNILQHSSFGFFYLHPKSVAATSSTYWRNAFKDLASALAERTGSIQAAYAALSSNLSVLQLLPYISRNFSNSRAFITQLSSVSLVRAFAHELVHRARKGEVLLIVVRGASYWGIEEELPHIVVYHPLGEARGAHLTRASRGGRAILDFLSKRF
jgi:hypothetical protein